MAGNNSIRGDETITFTDNMSFDGTERGGKMTTNAQVWLGSTIAPHVRNSAFSSSDGSLNLNFSTPTATTGKLDVTVNRTVIKDLHVARYIVSAGGSTDGANYTTIATAITAAAAAGGKQTVFIQPGTYTENLTLQPGINLTAFTTDSTYTSSGDAGAVIILGKCTFTQSGNVQISGIQLKTNSDFCISITGNSASILGLSLCDIVANDHTAIQLSSSSGSSQLRIFNCTGVINTTGITVFAHSGAGNLLMKYTIIDNNGSSTTASTISGAGTAFIGYSYLANPISFSSSSVTELDYSEIFCNLINTTAITTAGTAKVDAQGCVLGGGSSSSISVGTGSTVNLTNSIAASTNTNNITGLGTVSFTNVSLGTSTLINATTQIPGIATNDAIQIKTPGAYPYTAVPQDAVILVDTTSARTINLNASPVTGQKFIIKDSVGSAATNNITVTPNSGNIDGAASYTMNINYGSITIVYNGSEWSII